ncbi:M13-type metalloendopeptidase [Candidatus Xianfuyuplasma coldseepsis]|uniref:M13 family peptidase n=1 Tax=Candidatus Xianfuyuplasma coldseepsis TaxID=2782163 RepID=A0A7L7KPJ8_9MOLU|nr:M13-type metalloendopeptidase [Xianfuyuplasma coldseepsis]QMS84711.1 M13 family peptidase [Xianfuyuplasma coldseepsis]
MNSELLKKNFYEAVNGKWIEKAVIPGDQPAVSTFLELHLGIEKTLMNLTKKWEKVPSDLPVNLQKFIALYRMTKEYTKREELGTTPFEPILQSIQNVTSLDDLHNMYKQFSLESIATPFTFDVNQDFLNSNNQILYFSAANLFLPDTSYYQDEAKKAQLIGLFTATTTQLLSLYGFEQDEVDRLLTEALAFDELLVPVTKSSVEKADYVKMYNPVSKAEIQKLSTHFDLIKQAEALVQQPVDQLIVTNLDFIHAFDDIICEDNFNIIKSWMIVSNAIKFANDLTDEIRIAGGAFRRGLSGIKEAQSKEKFAFYQAYNRFDQVVGLYYGETYFGPVAKGDVKTMVHEIIGIYQERISDNTWLNKETKEKAIRKLSTLSVHVGYPDELPPYYDQFDIKGYDQGSDLVQERLSMDRIVNQYQFDQYHKEPNKNLWFMPASMVNAYYNPSNNQIVFPAAILQQPYYSIDQSKSENYGGVGAVMAHEISHAFDNNGAKFDETGSLFNWWTDQDLEAFNNRAKDMIALFDGVETGYGPCNGELTVSENIADSGGLRCALEASKKNSDHNYDEFFQNWARCWRMKASLEFKQLLLKIDVHGPAILRANLQLSNMPEFQDFYKITKDDEMYLDKDKMVSIW